MTDFYYRTEDIRRDDLPNYYVETTQDRHIINTLKSVNPIILVGSRGVGKSFLLRMAEYELRQDYNKHHILPVYISFTSTALIHTGDPNQFRHWMIAKIASSILRVLNKSGLVNSMPSGLSILAGGTTTYELNETAIEKIASSYEKSWENENIEIDSSIIPTVDQLKEVVEDLCDELSIRRLSLFIDEAAHIFIPKQQRDFFTLFRDLRSPYITCNAAVYPGVTSFGDTFQPTHDATMVTVDRNIFETDYVDNMLDIVAKQVEYSEIADADQERVLKNAKRNKKNFTVLAYAASGNPRLLLKTLAKSPNVASADVNEVIRQYYRIDIWTEHTGLSEKYSGHRALVDWGRSFIEDTVLDRLHSRNERFQNRETTCFFWLHRDVPQPVREAIRLLMYTGIVSEHATGIKNGNSEIGVRYIVSLGCLYSKDSSPTSQNSVYSAFQKFIQVDRMIEFSANSSVYQTLLEKVPEFTEPDMSDILQRQLLNSIEVLDITDWQKRKLAELDLSTVGDVLRSSETKLQEARYVGEKRSRWMRNAAQASVFEYLSG